MDRDRPNESLKSLQAIFLAAHSPLLNPLAYLLAFTVSYHFAHVPAFAIKSHWHYIMKVQMVVNSFSSSPFCFFTNIFCTKWVWAFAALHITKCLTFSVLKENNIWATSWKKRGGGGRRERERGWADMQKEAEKRSWKNVFKSIIVHKAVRELHTMRQKLKGNILTFYEKNPIKAKCDEHVCLCVCMHACTFSSP